MKGKKTGGRKKGARNKATQALRDQVAATGLTPHEIMIDNMRRAYEQALEVEAAIGPKMLEGTDDPQKQFERLLGEVKRAVGFRQIAQECAKDAAPYSHSRLASTEITGKDGGPLTVEIVRFAEGQTSKQLGTKVVPAPGVELPRERREASLPRLASSER